MCRDRRVSLAERVPRLSATFRRSLDALRVEPGSGAFKATFATVSALSKADALPGPADQRTTFSPGRAYVRRVKALNIWIIYRFDAEHVFVMTARAEPPVPADD